MESKFHLNSWYCMVSDKHWDLKVAHKSFLSIARFIFEVYIPSSLNSPVLWFKLRILSWPNHWCCDEPTGLNYRGWRFESNRSYSIRFKFPCIQVCGQLRGVWRLCAHKRQKIRMIFIVKPLVRKLRTMSRHFVNLLSFFFFFIICDCVCQARPT